MSFCKQIIFSLFIFCLSLCFPVSPALAANINLPKIKPIPAITKITGSEHIFNDSNFSQATHNFNPGQMVYVKVETSSTGDQQKILRLLDDGKNEIAQYIFNRSGDGQFTYTISFNAPNTPGIYYVDIKIQSDSNNVAIQENINVNGETTQEDSPSPNHTPTPNPTINPNSPNHTPINNTSPEASESASPSASLNPTDLSNNNILANIFTFISNFFSSLAQKLFKH